MILYLLFKYWTNGRTVSSRRTISRVSAVGRAHVRPIALAIRAATGTKLRMRQKSRTLSKQRRLMIPARSGRIWTHALNHKHGRHRCCLDTALNLSWRLAVCQRPYLYGSRRCKAKTSQCQRSRTQLTTCGNPLNQRNRRRHCRSTMYRTSWSEREKQESAIGSHLPRPGQIHDRHSHLTVQHLHTHPAYIR